MKPILSLAACFLLLLACDTAKQATMTTSAATTAAASSTALAAFNPNEVVLQEVTSVEGITEYLMPHNGLRVLLFPDQSKPTATVNITYLVGSRHEGYGETGMAHLLEHMVFQGTPKHPDIPAELTEHGARPNGTTSYDRTNYYETFSATDENMEWALDLEADRMVNSFIAKEDLVSEMTVVRNEFESGENSPTSVLSKRLVQAAYQWHNYGNSTIGARSDIENVPIERLQAFYRKYYQPDNAVLLVAGKFKTDEVIALIKEKFGVLPRPDRMKEPLYPTYTREPIQDGERFVELRRVGDVQAVQVLYRIPAATHPDYVALDVLVDLLTDEPGGRLYKALVDSGKASAVWGYARSTAEPSHCLFNAEVLKDDDLMAAELAMKEVLDNLAQNPPTEEEVKRAKDKSLKSYNQLLRNTERIGLVMTEYIASGDWRLAFIYRDRLEAVTTAEIAAVAAKYFKPNNRSTGRFIPEMESDRVEIPEVSEEELRQLVANYEGREAIVEGEEFDPSHDNIDSRSMMGTLPGTNFKYSLLPKQTRGNAVIATMDLRLGNLEALRGKATIGDLTGSMLMMGSEKYDRQAISDKLDELKARVSINGSATGAFVRIETEKDKLQEVLDFVGEILKNPTFPEEELVKMKKERMAFIDEGRSEPRSIASMQLSRRTSNFERNHPFYVATFDEQVEDLKAVSRQDLIDFHQAFYGASDATFGASGSMDAAALVPSLATNFQGWKSKVPFQRIERAYTELQGENIKIETPDKANAMFLAAQVLPINDEHPDYVAMVLGNYILGGGFLNSRLASRIRGKEGISYGVGSQFSASALDNRATFLTYAIYAPENREALEKAFREEIEKAVQEGFTQEEIDAARTGWIQSQAVSRAQDQVMAGTMSSNAYLGRSMQWSKAMEEKMASLTLAEVNAAIAKYIDVDKMISIKAGDFQKTEGVQKP